VVNERSIRWQHSRVLLIVVKNVVRILKFRNAEVRLQNIALRNAQMFIGMIKQGLRKLSCNVKVAAKTFMTIPVMDKDENSVRMNVQTSHTLKQRIGYAHIAEKFLRLGHHLRIFVVRGNVELLVPIARIGQQEQKCSDNVSNAGMSFGKLQVLLKNLVESFALKNAKLILNELMKELRPVFMQLVFGFKLAREYFSGTIIFVKLAVLMVTGFMSTIKSLREMVGLKLTKILSLFVRIAIEFCTTKKDINVLGDSLLFF